LESRLSLLSRIFVVNNSLDVLLRINPDDDEVHDDEEEDFFVNID